MKELILMRIGKSGPQGNNQLSGSGGQRSRSHEAKIGDKNPFRWFSDEF